MPDKCTHPDINARVTFNRLEDTGRFTAELEICCAKCGKPFRFIGLPMGLDLNGACVSPNGLEARLAIHPAGEAVPNLPAGEPEGFRIMNRGGKSA